MLVEDDDDSEGKGFVMLTADINVRLKKSLKEKGTKREENGCRALHACTVFCMFYTSIAQQWSCTEIGRAHV